MDASSENLGLPDGTIVAIEDNDELIDAFMQELLGQGLQSVANHGTFHLVLSSNSELDMVYARMMYDPDLRAMPWKDTHVWLLHHEGDEVVNETIISHSGIPEEHVHRCCVETLIQEDPEVRLDCCIVELDDVPELGNATCNQCSVLLVLAQDRDKLAALNTWSQQLEVFWFTKTIDLNQENL
jgi:hypothetical protein